MLQRVVARVHSSLGGVVAYLFGPARSIPWFHRACELDPQNLLARHRLAWSLGSAGRFDEAEAKYRSLIQEHGEWWRWWSDLADALQGAGRHENALQALDRAIALVPDNASLHYTRGRSLVGLRRLEEAVGAFRRAVNLQPNHLEAIGDLGAALGDLRRWDEAVRWNVRVMAVRPNAIGAHNLGTALMELKRYQEAEDAFRLGLKHEPSNTQFKAELAMAIGFQERTTEAIHLLEAALQAKPADVVLRSALVSLLLGEDRDDEALHLARDMVQTDPSNALCHLSLGWVYIKLTLAEDALAAFEVAGDLAPKAPELKAGRACALTKLGRQREAMDLFNEIIAADPDFLERHEVTGRHFEECRAALRGEGHRH